MKPRPGRQRGNGHDLVCLLSLGLEKKFGRHRVSAEDLERDLRLAFHLQDWRATALYRAVKAWESAHPGFLITE